MHQEGTISVKKESSVKNNSRFIYNNAYKSQDFSDRNYLYILGFILAVSFLVYLPVLKNNAFVWDDEGYILNNQAVQSFNLTGIFSDYVMGNYHPFTMLFLAVEHWLFGLNPTGYHVINLFLHLINVLLVYYALCLIGKRKEVAFVASLLFGIHPLHVESVAWASGIKDLLYTLFFLASYIYYLKYFYSQKKKYYFVSILVFTLSLLSKAMAVTLPVLFLLTDYFTGRKITLKALYEKIPFFLLAILFGIIAIIAQKTTGAVIETAFPLLQRFAFACSGFVTYLVKMIFPLHLSAYYPYPVKVGGEIPLFHYFYILIFIVLCALIAFSVRYTKKILYGTGFFTLAIFLVLQLYPVGSAIMADRYSYLSSVGIFYLMGEGFVFLRDKWNKWLPFGLLIVFALIFSAKTYKRGEVWKNNLTLWNDVIGQYQNVPVAYLNRGAEFGREKMPDKALDDFNKAIKLNPGYAKAYYNRAVVLLEKKNTTSAIDDLNKAVELNPRYLQSYLKRGNVFLDIREYSKALIDFNKVIELDPNLANAYNERGNIYGFLEKYDLAKDDFSRAIELNPKGSEAFFNRAILYLNLKEFDKALKDLDSTIALNPDDAEALLNRGKIYSNMQKYREAENDFSQVIRINPNNSDAYFNRGLTIYLSGKKDLALNDLTRATAMGNREAARLLSLIYK